MSMSSPSPLTTITRECVNELWGRKPRQFQEEAMSHILRMQCKDNHPQATMLIQPTKIGKSAAH